MARPRRSDLPWLVRRVGIYYVMWYDEVTKHTKRQSLKTRDAAVAQQRYVDFLKKRR